MRKKIFFLLIAVFFISGCSVEYNLVIDNDNQVEESVTILQKNSLLGRTTTEINKNLDSMLLFANDEVEPAYFYKKEKIVGASKSGVEYSYDFTLDNYQVESEILKNCYENYSAVLSQERLVISADTFMCSLTMNNDYDLTINITADGEVVSGNYHKKSGDTYTWILDENNSDSINLVLDRSKLDDGLGNILLTILVVGVVLIVGIIVLVGYMRNKNNNKL